MFKEVRGKGGEVDNQGRVSDMEMQGDNLIVRVALADLAPYTPPCIFT